MANLHIILRQDDDESVIEFLSDRYNVVKHDTSFKKAIESISRGQIYPEIIWATEYADKGDKELITAVRELRENITEATRIILILGEKRKNEKYLIEELNSLDIDYYAVDTYSVIQLKTWIETAKSKLPNLIWIAEEDEEHAFNIENAAPNYIFKEYKIANYFKDQSNLIKSLSDYYPDTIVLGYIQGQYSTEELVEEIRKKTDNKVNVIVTLDEENKAYEKALRKKGADIYHIKPVEQKESTKLTVEEMVANESVEETATKISDENAMISESNLSKINIIEKIATAARDITKDKIATSDIDRESGPISDDLSSAKVQDTAQAKILKKLNTEEKHENNWSAAQLQINSRQNVGSKIIGTIVVAFGGADSGVGTTHAAYAFSSFLSRLGYNTAFVEQAEEPVMYQYFREEKYEEIDGGYRVGKNLDVYVKYLNGKVNDENVYSKNYNFIVLDLGQIVEKEKDKLVKLPNFTQMQRANIPIIVGSGAKWQLTKAAETALIGNENWKVYINFANLKSEKEIKKAFKEICNKEAYLAPFTPDPFLIYKEQDIQFSKLIGELLDIQPNEADQNSILSRLKFFSK